MKKLLAKMMIPVLAMSFVFQGSLAHADQNQVSDSDVLNQRVHVADLADQRDKYKAELAKDAQTMKVLEGLANKSFYAIYRKHSEEVFGVITASGIIGMAAAAGLGFSGHGETAGFVFISSVIAEVIGFAGEGLSHDNEYELLSRRSEVSRAELYKSLAGASERLIVALASTEEQLKKEKQTLNVMIAQQAKK
jgi:hypothetical protein